MGQERGFDEETACLWSWWWLISNYPLHVFVSSGILTHRLLRSRHQCLGRWSVVDSTWCASKVGLDTYVGDGHTTNNRDFKSPLSGFPIMEGWQLAILYGIHQQKAKNKIYNHPIDNGTW
jgi:hypothetical protein